MQSDKTTIESSSKQNKYFMVVLGNRKGLQDINIAGCRLFPHYCYFFIRVGSFTCPSRRLRKKKMILKSNPLLRGISSLFIGLIYIQTIHGNGYIITTPRRWTSGSESQICVSFRDSTQPDGATASHNLKVSIQTTTEKPEEILPEKNLLFAQELGVQCVQVQLPETSSNRGEISIYGVIGGNTVNYTKPISISIDVTKTFVQTDKYLYKPSQTVKFRILTVDGPKLRVSTDQYKEIYVENPSGTRIAQWLNVSNSDGLIHQEFQLSEEPEEGTYKINVRAPNNKIIKTSFKVEDYVLPRYEVKVNKPKFVLGTSEIVTFEVCAKYTFGQPVKGKVTLIVDNGGWGSYLNKVTKQDNISGCTKLNINSKELNINHKNFFAHKLNAEATVIEDGTDVELVAERVNVDISRTALSFEDIGTQKFYKPESVFVGEVKVTFPDDSPASDELMKICLGDTCKNITTSRNGILKFAIPPHLQDESINVEAVNYPNIRAGDSSWRSVMYESSFNKNLKKYHSPTNSSLVIELVDDKVNCIPGQDIEFSFPVLFSAVDIDSARVSVQVISRGQIVFASNDVTDFRTRPPFHGNPNILLAPIQEPVTKNLIRGSFTKTVKLTGFASPKAMLIVFYSRPDGEVVSDTRTVDITECLLNPVNLTWSKEKVKPGDESVLSLTAEPNSLCSLGVVDKSVQLLSAKNTELTISKILDVAEKASVKEYENLLTDDYEYCRKKQVKPPGDIDLPTPDLPRPPIAINRKKRSFWGGRHYPFYSDDVDALHMFDNAGIYVFSDMQLESRPCRERRPVFYHHRRMSNRVFKSSQRRRLYSSPGRNESRIINQKTNRKTKKKTKKLQSTSQNRPRTYLPETWLWKINLIQDTGISNENLTLPDTITEWIGSAVCVHPTKGVGLSGTASIITFTDFFTDLTLPASVKRGETFPVKISVFNYIEESLPIKIVLEESTEYEILADKGTAIGSGERSSCIPKNDKTVHSIRIKPTAIGNINITVTAFVDINALTTCGNSSNQFRTDTLIKPIKVEIEGFEKDLAWTQYVCTSETDPKMSDIAKSWNIAAPENIIPDSARGFITAVGNLMGPTIENLGKLIKMPYGCGEQNMLNFAPNIFVMPYLDKNETRDLAEKAIDFMKKGYQRELNYRHKDGSYSAFGESDDSGSTWLTAFVLKSFAQARNYISIDSNDLTKSQDWLKTKQLENGCFQSVGKVLHKGMKGGISKSSSTSLLSSFVLIALLEAGEDRAGKVIKESLICLNADTNTNDSYALAVKSYALALTGSPMAEASILQLMSNADNSGSSIHWSLPSNLGSSVEVETAGYAVLALLTHDAENNFPHATSIVQWMNNKRNGQGGFVSTQDTIVALQAIAKFDELTNKGPIDLDILIEMSQPNAEIVQTATFYINDNNDLLQQKTMMPIVPLDVNFVLFGEGCALLQGVLKYNEPQPEASEAFQLTVNTHPLPDKSCKTKGVRACVSYLLPDLESNMGIIEFRLISGYIPLKADLKKVIGDGTGLFKRYEVDGNLVTFYVDQFSTKELCVSFGMKLEAEVENPKPGLVKVYDYYKPEYYVTETYEFPNSCYIVDPKTSEIHVFEGRPDPKDLLLIEPDFDPGNRLF